MAEVDERIVARRREVRQGERQRRLRRTMGLLAIAVVVAALVAVERSSLVALERIEVRGVEEVATEDVLDAAELELGTSTVRLRLGAAEERVEAMPRVLDATVSRADPLTVVIDVRERVAVLRVVAGERQVLLDAAGVVIDAAVGDEDLPTIELDGATAPAVGDTAASSPTLAAAVAVHDGLPGPLRARVLRYASGRDGGVSLVLDDATLVRFGDDGRVDEKSRALGAVLEDLGDRHVDVIDVRAPRAPVVVPDAGDEASDAP